MAEVATNVNGEWYLISWKNVQMHCEEKEKETGNYNAEQEVWSQMSFFEFTDRISKILEDTGHYLCIVIMSGFKKHY